MRILVVNAGSSSLKLSVLDEDDRTVSAETIASAGGGIDERALAVFLRSAGPVDAVGHRVVHGGREFTGPVLVDPTVLRRLRGLVDLAPLHQPKSLAALQAVGQRLPGTPAVACFDTAFHAGLPAAAATYALPVEWRARFGLRRFGFHGLSHAYATRRSAELLGRAVDDLRLVTCHLGAGASLAAVSGGRSVDTTMGFTPLDGLVMATRSGSVDPGLLLWLIDRGVPPDRLADDLEHRSGLLGLTGSADMRAVVERAAGNDADAALALAVYLHRLRGAMAAMAASLGGLDGVVFTGGVGENSPAVRAGAADGLGFLGLAVDPDINRAEAPADRVVSPDRAPVACLVVAAREDLQISRETRAVLTGGPPTRPEAV